jgi:hypothetical protein
VAPYKPSGLSTAPFMVAAAADADRGAHRVHVDTTSPRRDSGAPHRVLHYRNTRLLVRRDGARRWHTFSGSEPDPLR